MNLRPLSFYKLAAAAGITFAFSLIAYAATAADDMPDHCNGPMMSAPPHMHEGMPPMGSGPGPMGMPPPMDDMFMQGFGPVPPFLHDLALTEAQQDKVFAITHANAPSLREQSKIAKKSADALHELAESSSYDEAKLKTLSETNAHAMAELEMIHVRTMHQILALLTPDQRKQFDAMKTGFNDHHAMRTQIKDINAKFDAANGSGPNSK